MSAELIYVIIGIIALAAGLFGGMYIQKLKTKSNESVWEEKENQYNSWIKKSEEELKNLREEKHKVELEFAEKKTDFKNLMKKLEEHKDNETTLQEKFENLANRIFNEKTEKFSKTSKEKLEGVLNPLTEKIKEFREKVEGLNSEQLKRHSELGNELKHLRDLNKTIGLEAQNLTKTLKGDKKIQGNWGELILEKVLERSGLEKDIVYTKQQSLINQEGDRQQPDFIINLPDNRKIIVDSKVSLISYNQFINEDDEDLQKQYLHNLVKDLWNHVLNLSAKNYHELYQVESPDFVLMFIPIETAFSAAVNYKPGLYDEAYVKKIFIVTPSTLLATLKTIESIWQSDKQRKNTLDIATQAGQLHDKFVGMASDLEKLESQLNTVSNTLGKAKSKLKGPGGIASKVNNLRLLGAKTNKLIDEKIFEDEGDINLLENSDT